MKLLPQPRRLRAIKRAQVMARGLVVAYLDSETAEVEVEIHEPALRRLAIREKHLVLGLEDVKPLQANSQYRVPSAYSGIVRGKRTSGMSNSVRGGSDPDLACLRYRRAA